VLRRRIGRDLSTGDENEVPVQAAIHDTNWQIVLKLEPPHFSAFITHSRQLEKPADDRDNLWLLYAHGTDDEMFFAQLSNLDTAQMLRLELNPRALQQHLNLIH